MQPSSDESTFLSSTATGNRVIWFQEAQTKGTWELNQVSKRWSSDIDASQGTGCLIGDRWKSLRQVDHAVMMGITLVNATKGFNAILTMIGFVIRMVHL